MEKFVHLSDKIGKAWVVMLAINSLEKVMFKTFTLIRIQMIACKCLPETKKDRVYTIDLSISHLSNSICGAKCTCPAGRGPSGNCKCIAAICFAF